MPLTTAEWKILKLMLQTVDAKLNFLLLCAVKNPKDPVAFADFIEQAKVLVDMTGPIYGKQENDDVETA